MVKNKTLSVEEKIKQVKLIPPQIERADLISKIERLIREEDFTLFSDISKELEEFDSALTVDYDFFDVVEDSIRIGDFEKYNIGEIRLKEVPYEVYKEGNEIIVRNLVNKDVQKSERMFLEFDGFTKEGFLPSLKGNFLPVIIQLFEENSKERDDLYCGEDKLKLFNGFKIKGEPYIIQHYAVPLILERNIGFRKGLEARIIINGGVVCDGYFGNVLEKRVHNFTVKNLEWLQQKILENKLKKRKKKLVKKGIAAAALISGAIWIGSLINSYYTSPEYLRRKELEKNCLYILPSLGEKKTYQLDNGNEVIVHYYDTWWPGTDDYSIITLNDNIKFLSEHFVFLKGDNARVLRELHIKEDGKWEVFPKENSKNYYSWQKEYEGLIEKIAEKRFEFEKSRGKQYKEPASEPVSQTIPHYKQTSPSNELQNKKPQLETSINKTQSYNLTKQTKTQSLEEIVETNLENWCKKNLPPLSWMGMRYEFEILDYNVSRKNIWAVGDYNFHPQYSNYLLRSSDGGENWEVRWKGKNFYPFAIDFSNSKEGWVCGKSGFLCTDDEGDSWKFQKGPSSKYWGDWIAEFKFLGNQSMMVRLRNKEVYKSLDGGKTWKFLDNSSDIAGKDYWGNSLKIQSQQIK